MTLTVETELTAPIALATADGHFNQAAHGWARQPIVDTSRIDGTQFNGLNRRWEYWCIITPTHFLGMSIAKIDFAFPASLWIFDRAANKAVVNYASFGGEDDITLPPNVEDGPARARVNDISVDIEQIDGGTRIRGSIPNASFDIVAARPEGHERLAVVVPWDDVLFQYTVKDVSRPATGSITVDGTEHKLEAESWAILDHGRGRWPHEVHWNWGSGCGRSTKGEVIGIQVGDKWTDGTGSTENSFLLGKKIYKISEKLNWQYDTNDYMQPWRVSGGGLDATLTPCYDKQSAYKSERVTSSTDQCFGVWKGSFNTGSEIVEFDNIPGFAEDVTKVW